MLPDMPKDHHPAGEKLQIALPDRDCCFLPRHQKRAPRPQADGSWRKCSPKGPNFSKEQQESKLSLVEEKVAASEWWSHSAGFAWERILAGVVQLLLVSVDEEGLVWADAVD